MASTAGQSNIDDDSMDAATSDDRDLVRKACTYITEGAYPAGATANGLRHVEASHDYPWPPYIPGLFVAGAIIGPQRGGQGRTNYGSHNRPGGTSYGGLSCH